jgi:hypothetical protein
LLADEFIEFASDGAAYTKAQLIDALHRETRCLRSLTEFHLVALSESIVLATFRATRQDETSGATVESLHSSIWLHRSDRWQLVFHQGTPRRKKSEGHWGIA